MDDYIGTPILSYLATTNQLSQCISNLKLLLKLLPTFHPEQRSIYSNTTSPAGSNYPRFSQFINYVVTQLRHCYCAMVFQTWTVFQYIFLFVSNKWLFKPIYMCVYVQWFYTLHNIQCKQVTQSLQVQLLTDWQSKNYTARHSEQLKMSQ